MVVVTTTETYWSLAMCNNIHFTKVRLLFCYLLQFNAAVWNSLNSLC